MTRGHRARRCLQRCKHRRRCASSATKLYIGLSYPVAVSGEPFRALEHCAGLRSSLDGSVDRSVQVRKDRYGSTVAAKMKAAREYLPALEVGRWRPAAGCLTSRAAGRAMHPVPACIPRAGAPHWIAAHGDATFHHGSSRQCQLKPGAVPALPCAPGPASTQVGHDHLRPARSGGVLATAQRPAAADWQGTSVHCTVVWRAPRSWRATGERGRGQCSGAGPRPSTRLGLALHALRT
jgi:hypothetical protein